MTENEVRIKMAERTYTGNDSGRRHRGGIYCCIDCEECEPPWLSISNSSLPPGFARVLVRPRCALLEQRVNFLDSCDAWKQRED